ncbi:MAG: SPW repeat protein [Bacteriovoracaceae bacterium]|nr:SPW repeat protein [Bacteriovoracaceae bacterium]
MINKLKWTLSLNYVIGFWVFILPWTLGPGFKNNAVNVAMWNFLFIGLSVIVLSSLTQKTKAMFSWEYWLLVLTGIWLMVSPWFLLYFDRTLLMWNSIIFGMALASANAFIIPIDQRNLRKNFKNNSLLYRN